MKKLIFIFLLIGTTRLWGGDCPQPSFCEAFKYAKYAEKVYRDNSEGTPFNLGCPELGFSLPSVRAVGDGLYAEVFKRDDGYVIAFRGTKEDQDISDDVEQGLDGHNEQFAEAMEYFELVNKALNDCGNKGPRTIVGHSLGGALAQHVATVAEQEPPNPSYTVVTFNPAALLPANSPAPKVCIFNYVNGNDILKRVVNPLVAEIGRADRGDNRCTLDGPSRSSGTDIPVGKVVSPYDFTGDLTKEDVAELRRAAEAVPEIKKFMASGNLNIIFNSDKLDQIITKLSRIKGLEKVFTRMDRKLGADWKNLCSEANAIIPIKVGPIGGPKIQPFLLISAKRFQSSLDKVLGSAVDAHGFEKITNKDDIEKWEKNKKIWDKEKELRQQYPKLFTTPLEPLPPCPVPEYDPDGLLVMLEKQCNDDTLGGGGGKNGDGSPGTTPGNGPGSGIVPPPTVSPGIIGISPPSSGGQPPPKGTAGGGHWDGSAVGEGYEKGTYQKTFNYNQ